jgi:hypothetical protein
MKLTYEQLVHIVNRADAIVVDSNLASAVVDDDGITFTWDSEDGECRYGFPQPSDDESPIVGDILPFGIRMPLYSCEDAEESGPCHLTFLTRTSPFKLLG